MFKLVLFGMVVHNDCLSPHHPNLPTTPSFEAIAKKPRTTYDFQCIKGVNFVV